MIASRFCNGTLLPSFMTNKIQAYEITPYIIILLICGYKMKLLICRYIFAKMHTHSLQHEQKGGREGKEREGKVKTLN